MAELQDIASIPERIAARRRRGRVRHARVGGAAGGTLLAVLAAVAMATAEDPTPDGAAETTAQISPGATGPTGAAAAAEAAPGASNATSADDPPDAEAPAAGDAPPADPPTAGAPPAADPPPAGPPPADDPPAGDDPPASDPPATTSPSAATPPPTEPSAVPGPTSPAAAALPALAPEAAPAPAAPAPSPALSPRRLKLDPVYKVAPLTVSGKRRARPKPTVEDKPRPTETGPAADDQGDRRPAPIDPTIASAPAPAPPPSPTSVADGIAPPPSASAVAWSGLTGFEAPLLSSGAAASFTGPRALLPIYLAAGLEHDIPWELLAAINQVETDFGRNVAVSSAGAVGWMQFMPATWAAYGEDGDGDGVRDPDNPVDAIFAAAAYLKASGAPKDLKRAVFAYNHSDEYVANVLGKASGFAGIDPTVLASLTAAGLRDAASAPQLAGHRGLLAADATTESVGRLALLDDKALGEAVVESADVYPCGRQDIEAGRVDRRVLLTLALLAADDLRPTVTSLQCGHGLRTASGNISEHTTGTAVDIASINGVPVMGHQGPGTDAERVVKRVAELRGAMTAHQVISLMTLEGAPNTVSMGDHADHVHVGFRPAPRAGAEDEDAAQEADHSEK